MYDAAAQKLAVKVIGTVESSLTWDAINYSDPITVGVAQWFGVRAAAILVRMRDENPGAWTGVDTGLVSDLSTRPASAAWWNSRYLTQVEGNSLKPVLRANQAIQSDQLITDLDAYVNVFEGLGWDKDTHTQQLLYFMSMYHQSPRSALRVMRDLEYGASLNRIHTVALNDDVLSKYPSRYNNTKSIIISGDSSGVDDPPVVSPDDEGGNPSDVIARLTRDLRYIELVGNNLFLVTKDGHRIRSSRTGRDIWLLNSDTTVGEAIEPPAPVEPEVPPSGDVESKRDALVAWMEARINQFSYSQGAGRLNPDQSGKSDCSGTVWRAYKDVINKELGTYTGSQYTQGVLVTSGSGLINESLLRKGDLIFYNWPTGRPTVDHVEMYRGSGTVIGHGGPGKGPTVKTLSGMATAASNWYVRRHVT